MTENRATSLIARLILPSEVAALVTVVAGNATGAINGSVLRTVDGIVRTVLKASDGRWRCWIGLASH